MCDRFATKPLTKTMNNLNNKVAIITGSSRGIGRAIAFPADVSKVADLKRLFDQTLDKNCPGRYLS